jgi:prepilin-type N-terminal cleavage/methylation domain-containing protein
MTNRGAFISTFRRRPAFAKPTARQARFRESCDESRHGFTLLEILLTLALIGLLAGVLVTGSANLLSDKPATPEEVFWKAVRQSRAAALTAEHEVRLSFDGKQQAFLLDDDRSPQALPVPPVRELTVDFLPPAAAGRSLVLIGGDLLDAQTVPFVTFYPDGTCSPFRVQFRAGGAAHVLNIDPWTCAPVLPPGENPS